MVLFCSDRMSGEDEGVTGLTASVILEEVVHSC